MNIGLPFHAVTGGEVYIIHGREWIWKQSYVFSRKFRYDNPTMKALRIGTRGSQLAVAQAKQSADAIAAALPGRAVELVPIRTRGDRIAGSLLDVGGKGLFTAELELALREGQLDLAVHSAKDVPVEMDSDLSIAAALPRADARDALVSRAGDIEKLPAGANVGTSSLRRTALLRAARADLEILPLRGNVETRIRKVLGKKPDFDATVLAMAGLQRGGWLMEREANVYPLPSDSFIPAAGQGTLVLQTRAEDTKLIDALQTVNHPETFQTLQAERSVLKALGASCHSCVAIHIQKKGPAPFFFARAMVARQDGSDMLRVESQGTSAQQAAVALAERLLTDGAKERLEKAKNIFRPKTPNSHNK